MEFKNQKMKMYRVNMKLVKIKETEHNDLVKFKKLSSDQILIWILAVKDIPPARLRNGRKNIGFKESVLIKNVF